MLHATFKNGDKWTGETVTEGQETFYFAEDKLGNMYETSEIPAYIIDMSGAPSSWEKPQ